MKTQKEQVESKMIKENGNGYIYRSVTSYDDYQDTVEFVVSSHKGETYGRFATEQEANEVFEQNIK